MEVQAYRGGWQRCVCCCCCCCEVMMMVKKKKKKREEEREEGGEDPFLSKGDVQLGGSLQRTPFLVKFTA